MLVVALLVASLAPSAPGAADVAGHYYSGDGTGVNWNLEIGRDGTFEFNWDGCTGNYDRQAGRWRLAEGVVQLETQTRSPDPVSEKSLPRALRPIPWGPRLYLVPDDELVAFCNTVNEGSEPRDEAYGLALLREKDWELPVTGKPAVPEGSRRCLLSSPVRGRLVKRITDHRGVVDRGSEDGLQPGMVLFSQSELDMLPYRVVSTSGRSSEVETAYASGQVKEGPVSTLLWDETLRPRIDPKP